MRFLIPLACAAALSLVPQQSQTVTDNDQVKVLKVEVQPHHKTQMHEHKVNRVMVYLQPGQLNFTFEDGRQTVLNWRAGEAKWSPAAGMHVAEITTNNPVTIVEIELKKPAQGSKAEQNPLDPVKLDPKHYKVAFENDQVRVLRVKIGAHASAPMHVHALNRVVVYLTDQKLRVTTKDGKIQETEHKAGDVAWAGPAQHSETNVADQPFDLYAVEVKN